MHKFIAHKHSFLSWQKDPILRETLERLSEIFLNITELEPWNALGDSEVIGVVDPLSGETFYNIFMGSMGTLFGIASYRGVLGYYCYKKAKSTSVLREQDEWHLQQNSILSTLEYPHEMYDDVRNTYQGYRIRLEDKKRHPSFIMYEPEFFPVIVSETKARSLLVVFEQILQVCNRLIRGDLTGIIKAKKIFCRVSSNEADGLVWRDSWQDVPDYVPEQLRFSEAAFTHFVKTQDRVTRNGLTWEIDYFIQELPVVNDTGRSFFPRVLFIVDSQSGFIFKTVMTERSTFADKLLLALSEAIKEHGKPSAILVNRTELRDLLAQSGDWTKIDIEKRAKLPEIIKVKKEFQNLFKIDYYRKRTG